MQLQQNIKIDFNHKMASHCENGVIANLFQFYGVALSEAMVFGIGSGIYFSYLPFIKMAGAPVISFRPYPGLIFKRAARSMGIKMISKRFKSPEKAMSALDENLRKGIPTGMVVGVYHLPYFPPQYRFHFNAHNIVCIGKENGKYLISDPIMDGIESLTYDELVKVRYAKGVASPNGKLYYVDKIPENYNIEKAIIKGIKRTVLEMVKLPGPIIGVTGMQYLSKRIKNWPKKYGDKKAARYLGQIVRMQEEIGTGGAGFRFLFAAFLQEASEILNNEHLNELALEMSKIGDKWREFAVAAGRICKGRQNEETYETLGEFMHQLSLEEKQVYLKLEKAL